MIRWLTMLFLGSILTLGVLNLPACGGSGPKPKADGVMRVVYIPKNTGNPYFDSLVEGFKKAATECGAEFTTVAPASADATSQISILNDQMERGVNVIAISPNSPDALNPTLKKAMDAGFIVVTVDSDLTDNEQFRNVGVLTVDPDGVGKSQIELMGSLMGYSGKFAILSATTDAPNQNVWIDIMKKTLKSDPKYKDMELVDTVYGNDEPQKSLTEAEGLMTKYPDLKGIIAPTTVGIHAAAQAVQNAKKADKVHVTGLGLPNEMRPYIKDGTVTAFSLWSPADEGYLACQVGIQIAKKTITATPGTKFTAGTLGERTIGPKNVIITGQPTTFTKDNIDQFHF